MISYSICAINSSYKFKRLLKYLNLSLMEAYKPYVDYILASGVAETAYILSHEGAICATNLPIQQLPQYNFDLED